MDVKKRLIMIHLRQFETQTGHESAKESLIVIQRILGHKLLRFVRNLQFKPGVPTMPRQTLKTYRLVGIVCRRIQKSEICGSKSKDERTDKTTSLTNWQLRQLSNFNPLAIPSASISLMMNARASTTEPWHVV